MDKKLYKFYSSKAIPKKKISFYIRWLNKFVTDVNGDFDQLSWGDIQRFGNRLENDGYTDWQVKQAKQAVCMYNRGVLKKNIGGRPVTR